MNPSIRWYITGLIGSLSLLAIAYFYFQLHLELTPCPLCMFQRATLVCVAFICVLGLLQRPKVIGQKIYSLLILAASIGGASFAGRQVWLQHLPPESVPTCGIDPIYRWTESMGESFSFFQMIRTVLEGSGDCAEIDWALAGVSMGGWMLLIFTCMAVLSLYLTIKSPKA